jgi:endonuclease VIII
MPEGDTIYRTASSIRRWMDGRVVTAAESVLPQLGIGRVVGRTVTGVDAVGKHLLITFPGEPTFVLRTHMRMTGSWHVYSASDVWQRPRRQARVILEAGDHLAVCFNAPIIDLLADSTGREGTAISDAVGHLGPDILADPFDVQRAYERARARSESGQRAIGEVLLDQRIVAGIGNIYRCESLFAESISPWRLLSSIDDDALVRLLLGAERLMKANLGPVVSRNFGIDRRPPTEGGVTWVYRRAQKPCLTCGTLILSRAQGDQARTAYWCPSCQR